MTPEFKATEPKSKTKPVKLNTTEPTRKVPHRVNPPTQEDIKR